MSRLETYIAAVLSRIKVDDARRVEIDRELRARLAEAIDHAMTQGLSREEAEEEVMAAFGEPTVLAKKFTLTKDFRTLVVERVCLGALILWWFIDFGRAVVDPVELTVDILMVVAGWIALIASLYDRIGIENALVIWRLGRKTHTIPLEQIRAVRFESGHLFGKRNIVVEYTTGAIKLSPRWRGYRAAAITLAALFRERMEPDVYEVLTRIPVTVRRESRILRWMATLLWIVTLGMILTALPRVLDFRSPTLAAHVGSGLALVALALQVAFHTDKNRRAHAVLLLPVSVAVLLGLLGAPFFGFLWLLGGFYLAAVALPCLCLALLHWRGRQFPQFVLGVAVIVSLVMVVQRSRQMQDSMGVRLTPPLSGAVVESVWLDKDDRAFHVSGDKASSILFLSDTSRDIPAPGRLTHLTPWTPGDDGGSVLVEREISTVARNKKYAIYRVGRDTTAFPDEPLLTTRCSHLGLALTRSEVWSADGRFMLYKDYVGEREDPLLLVYDSIAGATMLIRGASHVSMVAWKGQMTIRAAWADHDKETDTTRYGFQTIDLASNHIETEYQAVTEPGENVRFLRGFRYVLLQDRGRRAGEDAVARIRDASTGEEIDLGRISHSHHLIHSWREDTGRAAFVTRDRQGNQSGMAIVDVNTGQRMPVPVGAFDKIEILALSPDGTKVAYQGSDSSRFGFPLPTGRIAVHDRGTGKTTIIARMGTLESILLGFGLSPGALPQWSADGKEVLFQRVVFSATGPKMTYRIGRYTVQ